MALLLHLQGLRKQRKADEGRQSSAGAGTKKRKGGALDKPLGQHSKDG